MTLSSLTCGCYLLFDTTELVNLRRVSDEYNVSGDFVMGVRFLCKRIMGEVLSDFPRNVGYSFFLPFAVIVRRPNLIVCLCLFKM